VDAIASPPSALRCRVIEQPDDWATLRDCWDRLLHESPNWTPWQSWDFLSGWWRHLAETSRLRVFVVERDGAPCMVLPLQLAKWPWLPGVPIYMLEPIGMIMDVNRPRFALGRPDPAAFHCALEEIWRRHREWHFIRLDEKADGDDEVALLRRFAGERGLLFRQSFSHVCPYLDLRQPWETYLQSRGRRLRKNLRACLRRLERYGSVGVRMYSSPDEIADGLDVVIELHKRSWKHKKQVEHSESVAYQAFYREFLLARAAWGGARILALCCDDRPVAATVALLDGTAYYSAQIVHDAAYAACSPGTLLEGFELEGLMNEGRYETYDFLGSFLNNKLRWTSTALPTNHVFVMRNNAKNVLIDNYYFRFKPFIKPKVLKLRDRLLKKAPDR